MNTNELLAAVEQAGGALILRGERISYDLPRLAAESLLRELREQRGKVVAILQRQNSTVREWLNRHCVGLARSATNPTVLYREYCRWANAQGAGVASYRAFIRLLGDMGYYLDSAGMLRGLCLLEDFLAASPTPLDRHHQGRLTRWHQQATAARLV